MDLPICPVCKEKQYSLMDRKYLEISYLRPIPRCWTCDKKAWQAGSLTLADFEARESMALANCEGIK